MQNLHMVEALVDGQTLVQFQVEKYQMNKNFNQNILFNGTHLKTNSFTDLFLITNITFIQLIRFHIAFALQHSNFFPFSLIN